ncbi:MAG: glycosyltransferase family 2 protein [Deltaproteobacteria bacterium]|nr:glycosyltransferase family 2 protein [Deltaproteobacteria bacterium]
MSKRCSIIIRTCNEERWIGSCLSSIYGQTYRNFEVILVDNESTDRTIEKARQFPIDGVVTCSDYFPGKALNIGIRKSKGEYIVCLSGHCIPVNDVWLANLVKNLDDDPALAGVYGRQEPMDFSSDADKRDLLLIFGLDRRVQSKDSFFHNANSILRRELWEKVPFDEEVTNIEDRIWAKEMLTLGYKLAYEPEASVYHHHGIHQNGNLERCTNVVRILEALGNGEKGGTLNISDLNIIAIVPAKGPGLVLGGKPVLFYTVTYAQTSRYVKHIYVSTDNENLAETAKSLGAEAPFIRPKSLSRDYVGLEAVFKYSLEKIEESRNYPDLVVTLEPTFPFRPHGLIDEMIKRVVTDGLDTVVAARRESRSLWQESEDGSLKRLDSGYAPRQYKERAFVGLKGLCCVTQAGIIRQGRLLGDKVGLYEVDNPYSHIEVREENDFRLAEQIMKTWQK